MSSSPIDYTHENKQYLKTHSATEIITTLSPYVTDARKQKIADVLAGRLAQIEVAIEAPCDIHNAFAVIRSAEAFGIYNIHIIAAEGDAIGMRGVTQGAFNWVEIHYHDSLDDFLSYTQSQSLLLAGGALHIDKPLAVSDINIEQPLCLLFGNENRGLSPAAQSACDIIFQIPMVGMSESLNLSVSAAISLFNCSQRYRAQIGNAGDLSEAAYQQLQAAYYLVSVKPRLVNGLLG